MNRTNPWDLALKVLARQVPRAIFRLAGLNVDPGSIQSVDITVALAEFRADKVHLVQGADGQPEWGLYLEFQQQAEPRLLCSWFLKAAALTQHQGVPILLVALYLKRGDRATFPDAYTVTIGPLENEFRFHTIRLWERADRIRSGELVELAPLLVLCEDKPAEDALREEVELIRTAQIPRNERSELLGVAYMVGTQYLLREVLDVIFREDFPPLSELGMIGDWIAESHEKGRAEGRAAARRLAIRFLRARFGELPEEVVARIEGSALEECERVCEQAERVETLAELQL